MKFELKRALFLMTLTFTFLLPLLNALLMLRMKQIASLNMETRKERRIPLLVTAFFFVTEYYVLYNKAVPSLLKLLILSAAISVVITVICNLFFKISAHMVGIGGLCGGMFVLGYILHFQNAVPLMIALVFIAGLVGMARLQLNAHTPFEVFSGFILGVMCPLGFLFG